MPIYKYNYEYTLRPEPSWFRCCPTILPDLSRDRKLAGSLRHAAEPKASYPKICIPDSQCALSVPGITKKRTLK